MKRARIVLADDHQALRETTAQLLAVEFDVVGAVENGKLAIEAAASLRADIVVLDISMPVMNGIEAASLLKKSGLPAKVVFLTTQTIPDFVTAAFSAGALGYVAKKCLVTDLVPAIREVNNGRIFVSPSLGIAEPAGSLPGKACEEKTGHAASACYPSSKGANNSFPPASVPQGVTVQQPVYKKRAGEDNVSFRTLVKPSLLQRLADSTSAARSGLAVAGIAFSAFLLFFLLFQMPHQAPPRGGPATKSPPSEPGLARVQPKSQGKVHGQSPTRLVPDTPTSSLLREKSVTGKQKSPEAAPLKSGTRLTAHGEDRAVTPPPPPATKLGSFKLPILPRTAPVAVMPAAPPAKVRPAQEAVPALVLHRALKGHSSWVTAVAFGPKGEWLASASIDQTIKFWNVVTGEALNALRGKVKRVEALACSRDGHLLAAENSDNTVTLWNTTTGQEIRTVSGERPGSLFGSNWVYSIAFSPDSRWLAYGLNDRTVRLWDISMGRAVRDLAARPRSVIYIAFSPDGRWLATGGDDKSIEIWDADTGRVIRRLTGHKKSVYAVAFSPDGRLLASASGDKSVKLWNLRSGREAYTLTGHRDRVTSLAFSPDGRWLASGSWDHTVKVWDVNTGREVRTLPGEGRQIYSLAFDSTGRWLATGSANGVVELWRSGETLESSLYYRGDKRWER